MEEEEELLEPDTVGFELSLGDGFGFDGSQSKMKKRDEVKHWW